MSRYVRKIVVRRERWTLTALGWLFVLGVLALATAFAFVRLHDFLAITRPVGARLLVVEGWMPSFAYREAASVFRNGGYAKVVAVGVLKEDGAAGGDPTEDFAVDKLARNGVPQDVISKASYPAIQADRTYHAAMAVKAWLAEQPAPVTSVDVVTLGPHARRTRVLYEKALGDGVDVGVIAVRDFRIDPERWWRTSQGARSVIGEAIGYVYARFLFSPSAYQAVAPPEGGVVTRPP